MRRRRVRWSWAAALPAQLLLASQALAAPQPPCEATREAVVAVIIRHAEKAAEPEDDPPLAEAGRTRAAELARMLAGSGVSALYASDRRRTQETVQPLAERLGLTPRVVPAGDTAAVAEQIRQHAGGLVVVAAHSNTVGPIIEALGGGPIPPIDDGDYDDLFVVTVLAPGKARVLRLSYGLPTP
jgi:broad specificity phosphatase PhoE